MPCIDCGKPTLAGQVRCVTCKAEAELFRRSKLEAAAAQEQYDSSLVGVRGWLAFFCFQMVAQCLAILKALLEELDTGELGAVIFYAFSLGVSALIVGTLLARKPWAPRLTRFYLAALTLSGGLAVLASILVDQNARSDGSLKGATGALVLSILWTSIWFAYFRVSERVKRTYSKATQDVAKAVA